MERSRRSRSSCERAYRFFDAYGYPSLPRAQDSLGGNASTRLIATLSPAADCADESLSTLRFADRAKQVMVFVRRNEKRPVDYALVQRLQREVVHLRGLLAQLGGGKPADLGGGGGSDNFSSAIERLESELRAEREKGEALQGENKRIMNSSTMSMQQSLSNGVPDLIELAIGGEKAGVAVKKGKAFSLLGRWDRAAEEFSKAVDIDPSIDNLCKCSLPRIPNNRLSKRLPT